MKSKLMMFYNVENLYPPNQDSTTLNSFGLYNWDTYKYCQKIRKISNVFRYVAEDYGELPSIIGLAEIGSKSVLEDLTDENSPICGYEIIYEKSQDSRELSVALLFDKNKYSLIGFEILKFPLHDNLEFDTRDILHAEFLLNDKKFHVFVLHLPSQRNKDVKKDLRNHILQQLHSTLLDLSEKKEALVVMGDFNENPDDEVIQKLRFDRDGKEILINPFESLFKNQQFTTYHGKTGMGFDQILWSDDYLKKVFEVQKISAEIFNSPRLRNKNRKNEHFPLRTYSGSRYIGGWSDHFPVVLKLGLLYFHPL